MGGFSILLRLDRIENNKLKTIKDFGKVYSDNEGSAKQKCIANASSASYAAGSDGNEFPDFIVSYFEGNCDEKVRWKQILKNPFSK